jgi:hypothetical protein
METQEQQFQKGFNNGYLLAQYKPELAQQVTKDLKPENDYLDGLLSGKKEYEMQKAKEQIKNRIGFTGKQMDAGKDKPKDMGMDRDR